MVPLQYIMNYLMKRDIQKNGKNPLEDVPLQGATRVTFGIILTVVLLSVDYFVTGVLPKLVYGTSNIEPYPALIKYFVEIISIAIIGTTFRRWLHFKLSTKEAVKKD